MIRRLETLGPSVPEQIIEHVILPFKIATILAGNSTHSQILTYDFFYTMPEIATSMGIVSLGGPNATNEAYDAGAVTLWAPMQGVQQDDRSTHQTAPRAPSASLSVHPAASAIVARPSEVQAKMTSNFVGVHWHRRVGAHFMRQSHSRCICRTVQHVCHIYLFGMCGERVLLASCSSVSSCSMPMPSSHCVTHSCNV